jgi:hypothetical protein
MAFEERIDRGGSQRILRAKGGIEDQKGAAFTDCAYKFFNFVPFLNCKMFRFKTEVLTRQGHVALLTTQSQNSAWD